MMKNRCITSVRRTVSTLALLMFALLPLFATAQEQEQGQEQPQEEQTRSRQNGSRSKHRFRYIFKKSAAKTPENMAVNDSLMLGDTLPAADSLAVETADAAGEGDAAAEEPVSYDGAHLNLSETVWDFGDVARKGGDVVKEFGFVNNGTQPLVITGVTMSCTCIKVVYPKRPIAAGAGGVIKLIYEPHKMSPGTFYRVVQIHSNSVDGVRLLTVRGNSVEGRKIK